MLNHYATPPDTPGSTRQFDFASQLVKQGQQVTIFASGFSHRTRKEERLEGKQNWRRENIDRVDFIWLRTTPYYGGNDWRRAVNMLSYSLRVVPLGLRFKESPDVVLASSPHPFAGLAGWLLAKLKRAKFIFEVRDLWPQTLVDIGGYSSKNPVVKLLRVLEKFLYQRARKIVVLHPKASDYITKLGIPGTKILWVPNGVSPGLFSNNDVELPKELEKIISNLKSYAKFLVIYAGAHGIANALDTIIETAEVLQQRGATNVHFLLVGDGHEKERLIARAEASGLGDVTFHKSIPKNAVPSLLRASDMAVLSWRKSDLYMYGMSTNKLWDYMACAKPIVWAIDSAVDPVAEANCGITVSPEEPEEMAKAIMDLCHLSDKERRAMGMRGYEHVMKYHSVPVLADRLLTVLEEVTG